MKNLAGDRECDRTIAQELERAEIESVRLEIPSGEVPSRFQGRLGPIAFSRGYMYWIAEGPVPLAVALDLYEDRIGRRDVRVQGHGSGPPPRPNAPAGTPARERACTKWSSGRNS